MRIAIKYIYSTNEIIATEVIRIMNKPYTFVVVDCCGRETEYSKEKYSWREIE